MGAKGRGIQISGWLLVIASYGYALLLIRGIFLGITQGFSGGPRVAWLILSYLLAFAFAVYLFTLGRRAILIAKGTPRPKSRFGWGRILLGALLLYGYSTSRFHLLPTRQFVGQLRYQNQTQSTAGDVTIIVMCIGCVLLILSGIWKGVRRRTISPDLDT